MEPDKEHRRIGEGSYGVDCQKAFNLINICQKILFFIL